MVITMLNTDYMIIMVLRFSVCHWELYRLEIIVVIYSLLDALSIGQFVI